MTFLDAARIRASSLPTGDKEKILLEYLLDNAVGRSNAKPWRLIKSHLDDHSVGMVQTTFQQGILKRSRENDIFIASSDHGRTKGYYLIETPSDATAMKEWYEKRMLAEETRLANLDRLASSIGWTI